MSAATMSFEEKLTEAIERSTRYLPGELARQVRATFTPANIAIMAATMVVWAGAHAAGVGFLADIVALCLGVLFLGWTAFELAGDLYDFVTTLYDAKTDEDIDHAARLFADAVLLVGVGTVSAILLKGGASRLAASRAAPPPEVAPPPPGPPRPHWGENFDITRHQPDRIAPATLGELTPSARAALERPNVLLIRSVGGRWGGAGTNATSGNSWWRAIDMKAARSILRGLKSGRPSASIQSSLGRYGFRPGHANHAEVWITDLHTLIQRNPGAVVQVDGLGDDVLTTPRPNTLLYGIRRFRFDRRNPVQSYYELF